MKKDQPPQWVPTSPEVVMPVAPTPPQAAPTTIDEARAQGLAVAGVQITAPLAPKTGPIVGEHGSFVVTVVKDFWESPTVKAIRNAVIGAFGLALFGVAIQIVNVNGDIAQINLQTTQKIAIGTFAFSLASAYAAWWKSHDNDPIK